MHILFPYMARFKAINWTRYHHIFTKLAQMGHRITILQPPPASLKETNFQEINVNLHSNIHIKEIQLPSILWKIRWPLDKIIKKGLYCLACHSQIKKLISSEHFDAILLYNIPQAGFFKIPSTKKIIRIFDLADDYEAMLKTELGILGFKWVINLGRKKLKYLMDNADLILSVSYSLADDYPEREIKVLPNGVDVSRFLDSDQKIDQCKRSPVVGYIGAFEYFIDFELIISMAEKLRDIRFRLIGGGRDFEKIKKMVSAKGLDNVELPVSIPFNLVPDEISKMDICLNLFRPIPISHKACPMKLFEYLAMKKPVLSSELDEIKRLDPKFLKIVHNADEGVSAVRHLLANPEETLNLSESGFAWVSEKYDWKNIAENFIELIKEAGVKKKHSNR